MGTKTRLIAELRASAGLSHADAKRIVEARRDRLALGSTTMMDQPRILHLAQILMAVQGLPQWIHWTRHGGIPSVFEVPVNSWRDIDTAIPLHGVPKEFAPERVPFTRDRRGNWHFKGRVAIIEKELPLDRSPADEAVRSYSRQRLDPAAFDGIVRVVAVPLAINEFRNIPIDLELELMGPSPRCVLARDHHDVRLIDFDAEIECVTAAPIAFAEPQQSLVERAGVLYGARDGGAEAYVDQERRKLRDCKPGETVFAPINGGARTWHPLRIAFGCPSV